MNTRFIITLEHYTKYGIPELQNILRDRTIYRSNDYNDIINKFKNLCHKYHNKNKRLRVWCTDIDSNIDMLAWN